MRITIEVPSSPQVPAEQFLEEAASGWGWDPEQGITAAEYVMDRFEGELYDRFAAHRQRLAREAASSVVARPESRGMAVARAREEERQTKGAPA